MAAAPQQMGVLWPNGLMIADRDDQPDECSCPPCKALILPCFYQPRWFRDKELKAHGAEGNIERGPCCGPAAMLIGADLMNGQTATFKKYIPTGFCKMGAEDCCDDELHVEDRAGQLIGKAFNRAPCLCQALCTEHILAEVNDRNGVSRFERLGQPLLCTLTEVRGEITKNNWNEWSYPLYRTGGSAAGQSPIAYNTFRYWQHPCFPCFPICRPYGQGIKEFDPSLTPEEQYMLFALAIRNNIYAPQN